VTVTRKVEAEEERETVDIPAFDAVCAFDRLKELQYPGEPAFTCAQAIVVKPVEGFYFRHRSDFCGSVLVSQEAVNWLLTFPIDRKQDGRYVPWMRVVRPDGNDVFYTFDSVVSAVSPGAPVHAVPLLDNLRFLSPQPGDKLVVIRAGNCCWDENEDAVFILPEDVIGMETVPESEVRVL
jgi:hypothetical protein